MTDKILVLTTAGSEEEARKIARGLVESRLAACVNIIPRVKSVYRWQGEVEEAEEYLLVTKTSAGNFEAVRKAIAKLHSYEVRECIAVSIADGSQAYLDWITESIESTDRE
jgi:periplasmic divalent cation tolerance protein